MISNVKEDGRPIGSLGNAESTWHTDMSYEDLPPKASALHRRDGFDDAERHVMIRSQIYGDKPH